jgi:hypothetical protein
MPYPLFLALVCFLFFQGDGGAGPPGGSPDSLSCWHPVLMSLCLGYLWTEDGRRLPILWMSHPLNGSKAVSGVVCP